MREVTYKEIKKAYKKKSYKFFTDELDINIFAIRDKEEKVDDSFDCTMGVAYIENGKEIIEKWRGTTLPGKHWMMNFFNAKWGGTAIMVPGQYLSSFKIGSQWGKPALIQIKPIPVYRDGNKDTVYDYIKSSIMTAIFATNIHSSGVWSKIIDKWSAGCQVFQKMVDFLQFFEIVKKSAKVYGDVFSYTLFTDDEV